MTEPTPVDSEVIPPWAPGADPPSAPSDPEWERLDVRMLLVGPVEVVRQLAIPLIVALIGISSSQGSLTWYVMLPMLVVVVLIGFIPWLTTRYRVTETQFQQRKGLVSRKQLTAPLDRVRSVDLEASLLHRALGLTKVQVGTGVDDKRIELNSLAVPAADGLRRRLLAQRRAATAAAAAREHGAAQPHPWAADEHDGTQPTEVFEHSGDEEELARIDWAWLRFAPFSLSRLAIVAGAIGVLSQYGESLPFLDREHLDEASQWLLRIALPALLLASLIAAGLVWTAISVIGYIVQWWDLRLTRGQGAIRLTAGLFTTRSTSIEETRVRGVELIEPVLLRAVNGAELATLATGVGSGGVTKVLPPSPRDVCTDVGATILDDGAPLREPLVEHGPAARRRAHFRAQRAAIFLSALSIVATLVLDWSWWLPAMVTVVCLALGAASAEAEYAHLGHLLTRDHLTAGDGTWQRRRSVLERDGVIGWVVRESWFQRRRGLATLIATTAAGGERITVLDVPRDLALEVVTAVTPGAVAPFLSTMRAPD